MTAFPSDQYGNLMPVLGPVYGSSQEYAITTSNAAPAAINSGGNTAIVRVFAIGCDAYYRAGTGATAPTLVDGYIPAGGYVEVPMTGAQTIMWVRARAASGTAHVDYLG